MKRLIVIAALLWALPFAASAAAEPDAARVDNWAPLRFFVGEWAGTGSGLFGESTLVRSYAWQLGGKFLEVRSGSSYPQQASNPPGEEHTELGFFSYDSQRGLFVLRQFHVEGFVNQYALESRSDTRLVFTSESIEGLPAGWRARETYEITGPDAFVETFEVAEPGQDFAVYVRNTLTRQPEGAPRT